MDDSTLFDNSIWNSVHIASCSGHARVSHEQCMCSKIVKSDENMVTEFGNAFNEFLRIQDGQQLMQGCTLDSKEETFDYQEKEALCKERKLNQIYSSTTAKEKILSKCATFPCSTELACPGSMIGNSEVPDIACDGMCSMKSDKPVCTRSVSLPTSLNPVSAMKGSRERQGIHEKILTVTWAPEVYDPPVTSVSHAVKGHSQQRSRTSKRNSKHKHKGKSSRCSNEKKQYRKHIRNSEPRAESQATSDELFHQASVDFSDVSITAQESNCGSSFLKTAVGKVHISFAEAT